MCHCRSSAFHFPADVGRRLFSFFRFLSISLSIYPLSSLDLSSFCRRPVCFFGRALSSVRERKSGRVSSCAGLFSFFHSSNCFATLPLNYRNPFRFFLPLSLYFYFVWLPFFRPSIRNHSTAILVGRRQTTDPSISFSRLFLSDPFSLLLSFHSTTADTFSFSILWLFERSQMALVSSKLTDSQVDHFPYFSLISFVFLRLFLTLVD